MKTLWRQGRTQHSPIPDINQGNTMQISPLLAQKFTGKLLLRDEIHLSEPLFRQLHLAGKFTAIPSFKKNLHSDQCMRCNNKKPSLIGTIHCATCKKSHIYCRKCLEMGRILACEPLYAWTGEDFAWPTYQNPCTWQGELTPPQLRAAKEIEQTIKQNSKQLIWAVTGAGKTEMLFLGISSALQMGKRVCITTPRTDVVRELLPRVQQAFSQVPVQALYGGSRDNDGTAQLIIATTHQLLRFQRAFDVIIIDEIDAFPYHQDESLQFATNRAVKQQAAEIYLTATPRESQLRQIAIKQLSHCFVPLRYHAHPLPVPQFIADHSLKKQLQKNTVPSSFIHWLKRRKKRLRQLLIFVPTISQAERLKIPLTNILLANEFISEANQVDSVHAEDEERKEKITAFRNRELYALMTTTILERGVTFPSIDVVVFDAGHVVFDDAALVQIAGRAGRNAKDPTGEVIFIHNGKTDAMERAVTSIIKMNQRGKKLLTQLSHAEKK